MTTYVLLCVLVFGWDAAWSFMGVRAMPPWRLKESMEEWKRKAVLIDVRTQGEFDLFHIDGVLHCPEILADFGALDHLDRDKPLIVICMTGHRSPIAAYTLKKRGFKEVYNLSWGMLAWKLFGGPTV